MERIGVGEPDPGPVRDYGSSGSGSAACAHLAMACMGTEVSPVEESYQEKRANFVNRWQMWAVFVEISRMIQVGLSSVVLVP